MKYKPLGGPAYGSIGHLPDSRLGPGDHCVPQGQVDICTVKCSPGDSVFIEEKLDGSCCAVANINDEIVALTRKGYLASTSPYEQHWLFAAWVADEKDRFYAALENGERMVGEWLAQAHGTVYSDVTQPFWPFDVFDSNGIRLLRHQFYHRCVISRLEPPRDLWRSSPDASPILRSWEKLCSLRKSSYGKYTTCDMPEGLVYRVERRNHVDFLAKWVRPDKVDGCYLPEASGNPAVWNWGPKKDKP